MAVSFYRALSRLPRPSISTGASHARGKSMMVCGTLFSSQICLKVAAMPSAFPIPATTHWRAGGLPPARPAIWTGTAPRRYRAPDSPTPTHYPPIWPSPLPRKDLYTPFVVIRTSARDMEPRHQLEPVFLLTASPRGLLSQLPANPGLVARCLLPVPEARMSQNTHVVSPTRVERTHTALSGRFRNEEEPRGPQGLTGSCAHTS